MVVQLAGGAEQDAKERDRDPTFKEMRKQVKYVLPDGTEISIGEEKYLAPDLLFYPEKLGYEFPGVHDMLFAAINKADIDLKKDLYEAIYISGAGSKFPGFASRILNELKAKKQENVKVRKATPRRSKSSRRTIASSLAGPAPRS